MPVCELPKHLTSCPLPRLDFHTVIAHLPASNMRSEKTSSLASLAKALQALAFGSLGIRIFCSERHGPGTGAQLTHLKSHYRKEKKPRDRCMCPWCNVSLDSRQKGYHLHSDPSYDEPKVML
jgi:hypothetical protein